jgi:cell division protein FtsL
MNRAHRAVFTPHLPPRLERLAQAYKETPWQRQQQWIALFLLVVVALGLVAGLYLNITARAAIAGREIQQLEAEIVTNERKNADIETHLAQLMANDALRQRAIALGYQPVDVEMITYVVVPGYVPPQPVMLSKNQPATVSASFDPVFTQSLFDWFNEQVHTAAAQAAGN